MYLVKNDNNIKPVESQLGRSALLCFGDSYFVGKICPIPLLENQKVIGFSLPFNDYLVEQVTWWALLPENN